MIGAKRIVALIPARGGSKGVPGKNVRALGGRPLIEYTIETAFAVEGIDRVAVTTDDKKIRDVAAKAGAVVIDRPPELATAEASTEVALLHALAALEVKGERFDYVAVLEPTTPFRTAAGVRGALEAIVAKGAESLLSVVESREVQGWVEGGFFRPLMPGEPRRRQDRRPRFVETGVVYVASVDYLRRTGSLVADDWMAWIVPAAEALDINTENDFAYAEFLMRRKRGES